MMKRMTKKGGKRVLATAIGASVLLVAALVILIVLSIVLDWDVWSWFGTSQAALVYAIALIMIVYVLYVLVLWFTVWRHRK